MKYIVYFLIIGILIALVMFFKDWITGQLKKEFAEYQTSKLTYIIDLILLFVLGWPIILYAIILGYVWSNIINFKAWIIQKKSEAKYWKSVNKINKRNKYE